MVSAPLPITPRTAAALLAGHIRDTSTVGAVVFHPERHSPGGGIAVAVLLLVIGALVGLGAVL